LNVVTSSTLTMSSNRSLIPAPVRSLSTAPAEPFDKANKPNESSSNRSRQSATSSNAGSTPNARQRRSGQLASGGTRNGESRRAKSGRGRQIRAFGLGEDMTTRAFGGFRVATCHQAASGVVRWGVACAPRQHGVVGGLVAGWPLCGISGSWTGAPVVGRPAGRKDRRS